MGRQGRRHVRHELEQENANNKYQKPGDAIHLSESYNPLPFIKQ